MPQSESRALPFTQDKTAPGHTPDKEILCLDTHRPIGGFCYGC